MKELMEKDPTVDVVNQMRNIDARMGELERRGEVFGTKKTKKITLGEMR